MTYRRAGHTAHPAATVHLELELANLRLKNCLAQEGIVFLVVFVV